MRKLFSSQILLILGVLTLSACGDDVGRNEDGTCKSGTVSEWNSITNLEAQMQSTQNRDQLCSIARDLRDRSTQFLDSYGQDFWCSASTSSGTFGNFNNYNYNNYSYSSVSANEIRQALEISSSTALACSQGGGIGNPYPLGNYNNGYGTYPNY